MLNQFINVLNFNNLVTYFTNYYMNCHDLKRLCENKEITLTHDFNRGDLDEKPNMFLTVSTVFIIFTQTVKRVTSQKQILLNI